MDLDFVIKSFSQDETSEIFIGEWAEKRGIRDQLVIATKVQRCNEQYLQRIYKLVVEITRDQFAVNLMESTVDNLPTRMR